MYSITVSGGAYALLLSNLITSVILLRKQFKQWRNTSLYILSISDVLFSVLTSGVLFINYMGIYTDHNKWYNILSSNNSMQNQEISNEENKKYRLKRFNETFSIVTNENDFTAIPECNMTNVIMKYGMLFFPFTNSFVSLLIFSVQCNLNVLSFKCQCFKFLQSEGYVKDKVPEDDNSVPKFESQNMNKYKVAMMGETSKVQIDSKSELIKRKNYSAIEQCKKRFLQAFRYNELQKDNKIIVSIFVISQWIIPILVTGLLYLADYDIESYIKDIENIGCFNGNIFFDDCDNNIKSENMTQDVHSGMHSIPLYKDYINNNDLVRSPNSNNTQVNEIISKVQNIVHSILNNTHNTSHSINQMTFYNISELQNITKYLEHDTDISIMKPNNSTKNSETNLLENISVMDYVNLYNSTSSENNTDLWSNMQLTNDTNEHDPELTSFNSLMINSLKNISVNENNSSNETITTSTEPQSNIQTTFSTEAQMFTDEVTEITTQVPVMSNEHIYAELIKHIHNITTHYGSKKHKNNYQSIRKQPKHNKLEDFQYSSTIDQQNLLLVIKAIYQNDNTLKTVLINTTDKCFISIQFLKLHLLALLFIIYFLPILFSSILQQHGKLNCQIVLNRLKMKNEMLSNNFNTNFANNVTDTVFDNSTVSQEAFTSKQTPKCLKGGMEDSDEDYNILEQVEVHNKDSNKKWEKHILNEDDRIEIHLNVIKQVQNILMLFDTIKISLLCGTLLWTPILTEILFKVFTFLHVPEWSLNITYIGGITFGILRNIFNLKMIKLQEANTNIMKTNSIHPIDLSQN